MFILIVISVIMLFAKMYFTQNISWAASKFKKANCLVFGKKRTGKDLLFQQVIRYRKDHYFSIMPYGLGKKYHHIEIKEVSLDPNTYKDLIEGTIKKIPWLEDREKKDIYIPEGGQFLPSQYRKSLETRYPGLPLYMGLSGHIYDSNVHINYNGAFTRLWDKVREQEDD